MKIPSCFCFQKVTQNEKSQKNSFKLDKNWLIDSRLLLIVSRNWLLPAPTTYVDSLTPIRRFVKRTRNF